MATENKISAILNGLSESELKAAVLEMKELDETGVLRPGKVRELSRTIQEDTGVSAHDALSIAQDGVIRTAAFYWAMNDHEV